MERIPVRGTGIESVREEEAREAIDRILSSAPFSRSGRLREFIRFTVEAALAGAADRVKESTIAIDVYGREAGSYDPKADSIVRTEARRLRSKLDQYYAAEGRDDVVVLAYPKGSYVPSFSYREVAPAPAEPEVETAPEGAQVGPLSARKVAVALVVLAVAVASWLLAQHGDTGRESPRRSGPSRVAVLPFEDLSPSEDQTPLGLAMAEAVIDDLVRTGGPTVISRTSAQRFLGSDLSDSEIADRLGVDYLVKGSFVKIGDRCRIATRLVSGSGGTLLWSDEFEFGWSEVFDVQRTIAREVASQVVGSIASPPERSGRSVPRIEASEAATEAAYCLRQYAATRDEQSYETARRGFELALQIDSGYVDALAGYGHLMFHRMYPPQNDYAEVVAKGVELLERALAVDRSHARSLALLSEFYDAAGRRDEALELAQRAVTIDPNDAIARVSLAFRYRGRGFYEAAQAQAELATEADRVWIYAHYLEALVLTELGRITEASEVIQRMIGIHPEPWFVDLGLATVALVDGHPSRAAEVLERALQANMENPVIGHFEIPFELATALTDEDAVEVSRILDKHGELPPHVLPFLERLCLATGSVDLAVRRIRASHHQGNYRWLISEPLARPHLVEPEFLQLLEELHARWRADLRAAAPGPDPRPPELPSPAEVLATLR